MKLATFARGGARRVGLVEVGDAPGSGIVYPFGVGLTMRDVIDAGLDAAARLAQRARESEPVPLESVRLLPPLRPASVRDCVAFAEHVEGVRRSVDGATGEGADLVPDAWYDAPTSTSPTRTRSTARATRCRSPRGAGPATSSSRWR